MEKTNKKKLVVLTGSGISAESGISTFRDSNGLWNNYDVKDVATPEGFIRNPELVLDFYNKMHDMLPTVKPNYGHIGLVELEKYFDVTIITQNVDNLHEVAGSHNILHLHGELTKYSSVGNPYTPYNWPFGESLKIGDLAEDGTQKRPFIVWFNENVPNIEEAMAITCDADIFLVIGTSLVVYPAASLLSFLKKGTEVYLIDPNEVSTLKGDDYNINIIQKGASEGMKEFINTMINKGYVNTDKD